MRRNNRMCEWKIVKSIIKCHHRSEENNIGNLKRHLDPGHFDNIGVDAVGHWLKATAISAEAGLFAGFALRATVTVDTLRVITFQSKATWCHAGNGGENVEFLLGQLAVMIVVAILLIRALPEQEMIIAELQLLQPVQLITRDAFEIETVDTLTIFVALDSLWRS